MNFKSIERFHETFRQISTAFRVSFEGRWLTIPAQRVKAALFSRNFTFKLRYSNGSLGAHEGQEVFTSDIQIFGPSRFDAR